MYAFFDGHLAVSRFCCYEDSCTYLVHSCKNFSSFHAGVYDPQGINEATSREYLDRREIHESVSRPLHSVCTPKAGDARGL